MTAGSSAGYLEFVRVKCHFNDCLGRLLGYGFGGGEFWPLLLDHDMNWPIEVIRIYTMFKSRRFGVSFLSDGYLNSATSLPGKLGQMT